MQGYTYFSNFLPQNIDCGYSLEPPRWGGSNVYPQSMFCAKIRKISFFFSTENFHFLQLKQYVYIAWACFRNVYHFRKTIYFDIITQQPYISA